MPTADDLAFKDAALKNNKITAEQVEECINTLQNYESAGMTKPLSSVILEKGFMTLNDINAIYHLQGKKDQYIVQGYTIMETLGQGGLGIVYKARDSMGRVVALKVMFPHLVANADYLKRFMREAKISTELEHPNIVKGLAFGESAGLYFFAMEFVNGKSLKDVVKEVGILSEKEATTIILKVAEALKYAESRALVHRDIKPENIMLTQEGIPKLCDLGLAKSSDSDMSLTHTGMVVGTPYYISPEQALSQKDLDIRSDIYSLGITFYYLVTAEVPYQGDSVVNIISQHLTGDIASPREKNADLSDNMCQIITKMMAKDREKRYQTAQELIVDLHRFLRGEKPIAGQSVPHPPSVATQPSPTPATDALPRIVSTMRKDKEKELEQTAIAPPKAGDQTQNHLAEKTPRLEKQSRSSALPAPDKDTSKNDISQANTVCMSSAEAHVQQEVEPARAISQQEDSRQLIEKLEQRVAKQASQRAGKKIRATAAMFLLAVMAGASYLAYLNKQAISEWAEHWLHPAAIQTPVSYPVYVAGETWQQAQQQFLQAQKNIATGTPATINMALVKAATFPMGSVEGEEDEPVIKVQLATYYIDKYEVCNRDYAEFCKACGHARPPHWPAEGLAADKDNYPVVNVSFYDASLYAQWAGKRLPSEAEWEYAMKGENATEYPWGKEYRDGYANVAKAQLQKVTAFERGKTSLGIFNMAGNVWEWTASNYGDSDRDKVIKGGSFLSQPNQARASYRDGFLTYARRHDIGFRCAVSADKVGEQPPKKQ